MFVPYLATATGPLLRAGFGTQPLDVIINTILALLIAILVHELGHAVVADRLGDDTPRLTGHLTLNPFRHMDQFGILLLFVTAISGQGFTYGFTPVNERKLRERWEFAPALVSLAGPAMNVLLAAVMAVILTHPMGGAIGSDGTIYLPSGGNTQAQNFAVELFSLNIFLAVFNLIPIPPLDGWSIVSNFLTPKMRFELRTFVQYGPFILLILFFFEPQIHFFNSFIYPITNHVAGALGAL